MTGLDRATDPRHETVHDREPQPRADPPHAAISVVQRRSVEGHREVGVGQPGPAVAHLRDDEDAAVCVALVPDGVTRSAFSSNPSSAWRSRLGSAVAKAGAA